MLSPPDGVICRRAGCGLCWSRLAEHEQTRGMAAHLTTGYPRSTACTCFDELLGNLHFNP